MSQYLSGQKKLGEVTYHTNVENVDLILAGPYSPNPAELLEDELFKRMLENAREIYDYIIIDTPPMTESDRRSHYRKPVRWGGYCSRERSY